MARRQPERTRETVVIANIDAGGSWEPGQNPSALAGGRRKYHDHPHTLVELVQLCKAKRRG